MAAIQQSGLYGIFLEPAFIALPIPWIGPIREPIFVTRSTTELVQEHREYECFVVIAYNDWRSDHAIINGNRKHFCSARTSSATW